MHVVELSLSGVEVNVSTSKLVWRMSGYVADLSRLFTGTVANFVCRLQIVATRKHLQFHGCANGEESCCGQHSRSWMGGISGPENSCVRR